MEPAAGRRAGRGASIAALTAVLLIFVAIAIAGSWLATELTNASDRGGVGAGEQALLELTTRVAIINWVIVAVLAVVLIAVVWLGRQRLALLEAQRTLTEAHIALVTEQLSLERASTEKQLETAEHNLRSDRFSRAILQSTGGSASLRNVGLLALEDLSIEHEQHYAASTYQFLVAVLKEQTAPRVTAQTAPRVAAQTAPDVTEQTAPELPVPAADALTAAEILTRNRELFDRNVEALAADTALHGGTGLHLVDLDLSEAWLRGFNLSGATLTGVRLIDAVLDDVELCDAIISGCRAEGARLSDTNLTKARIHDSTFINASLNAVTLDRASISNSTFDAATITGTSFRRANTTGARFESATFVDCTFDEALLTGTRFQKAVFSDEGEVGTTFTKATLSSANFDDATLLATRFEQAAVNDTSFGGARLTGTSFAGANLRQTDFVGAELTNVNLDDTSLHGVDLAPPPSEPASV